MQTTAPAQPATRHAQKPAMRPACPDFSSGPCAKHPGWKPENLSNAVLGRSHRSKPGKARLQDAIARTREVLEVPADYLIGIVPGSDTGAVEMAMWSMLGPRPVQLLAFESFGKDWGIDAVKQLKLDAEVLDAPYGKLPDLTQGCAKTPTWSSPGTAPPRACACRTATSSPPTAKGITLCDATSACFAQKLDWASSMWSPSPGRRSWAERRRTAS